MVHSFLGSDKMDIRQAIFELKEIIESGIASKEETVLPGLGVLFETYYNSLSSKDELLDSLSHLLK